MKQRSAGYSLLEMVCALAIVGIIMAIAVPLFIHALHRAHYIASIVG